MGDRKRGTGSGRSDSSTDSIEIGSLRDSSSHTQTYDATVHEVRKLYEAQRGVEANIILIAHPEDRLLGTRFRLRPGSVIEIGRSPAAEISLPDVLSVSRTHARLEHQGNQVIVEDLGSTNGTYVNDRLITGETVLASGDRFQVGAVHFKFLHERDVENAYHHAIYNLVMRDGLTEIFNKRKFEEEAEREVARARRYDRPLALVLFDIDHFKKVNDTFGHLCGDFVLKKIVERARALVRAEQIFARIGGEEFVILCPETQGDQAMVLASRVGEAISERPIVYSEHDVEVTCSFGVSSLEPGWTHENLYEASDRALYDSKEQGRDRVTQYTRDRHGALAVLEREPTEV